jgi:hypothetical protein
MQNMQGIYNNSQKHIWVQNTGELFNLDYPIRNKRYGAANVDYPYDH